MTADVQENSLLCLDKNILTLLLKDRSSGKNIIWATDDYEQLGAGYAADDELTLAAITGEHGDIIRPRALKSKEEQGLRTRNMAEVFTPLWICNKMNNLADNAWFGRENAFNSENGTSWQAGEGKVAFPGEQGAAGWRAYLSSRRLEITCGEAPYLASRYDTMTGELVPLAQRIGLLDRKLRVINERTRNLKDKQRAQKRWLELAKLALQSVYGFEWAGDNVLLARENLLFTLNDYYAEKFGEQLSIEALEHFAEIISWNIWQMDGLKTVLPNSCHEYQKERQAFSPNLFLARDFSARALKRSMSPCEVEEGELQKCQGCLKDNLDLHNGIYCKIKNWSTGKVLLFKELLDEEGSEEKMAKDFKFDVVIGNPPYQENRKGDSNTATPVYHFFMSEAYKIGTVSMLITPARFLFNTGYTPKIWNQERLNDSHFKIMKYYPDSSEVFQNVDIKGGVAISYRDVNKSFEAIEVFTIYPCLNDIFHKVIQTKGFQSITDVMVTSFAYHFTQILYDENPGLYGRASKGHDYDLQSNVFATFSEIFFNDKPQDDKKYISILGREDNQRCYKYINRDYVNSVVNLDKYKLFISKAFGTGQFGEVLPDIILGKPAVGATITFLSVGSFDTEDEAVTCEKYLKTKFARTLLGVLKATQNGSKPCYRMIPLQDFTPSSDIDWSKSIHEIDLQLYKKYGLSDEEINFIETHVKEMV